MEQRNNTIAYRKLIAWQKADDLAFQIYQVSKSFPQEEKFGLVSQMRRAALSVAANIAEGYTRKSKKDKVHFYNITQGSLTEIEYYLDFSQRLGYLSEDKYRELVGLRSEAGRLLTGLIKNTNIKWSVGLPRVSCLLFLVSCLLFLVPVAANAATLYFSPSSGSYSAGEQFSVGIYASSADQAMNAVSGAISFPADKLEIKSISKIGSIISLWVQEPSFFSGSANFEGIVLNPGYTGSAGKILTLNFRAKSAGSASLIFSSGSVLANDGKGTNILTGLGNASFNFESATVQETPAVVAGAPSAPKISSPTNPDESKWYNNPKPKFIWDLPEDISVIRLLYDKNPDSRPAVLYSPAIYEKQIEEDIKDGIYYFHAQFRNKAGWGRISHFKFQIDATPPESFEIKFIDGKETDNPRPTIAFEAKDNLSGLDYYKIKIGEGDLFDVKPEISASVLFTLPFQSPNKRTIVVQAFDKAGNYTAAIDEFNIKPIQPVEIIKESKIGKIQDIWSWTISLFIMTIILVGLIILFLFVVWWGKYRLSLLKKKVSKESKEAEEALHRAVILLKEDIEKQVKMLEMTKRLRSLTDEEEKIIKHFKKDLDDAEKFILKEIKDIEQEGK